MVLALVSMCILYKVCIEWASRFDQIYQNGVPQWSVLDMALDHYCDNIDGDIAKFSWPVSFNF